MVEIFSAFKYTISSVFFPNLIDQAAGILSLWYIKMSYFYKTMQFLYCQDKFLYNYDMI